MKSNQLLPNDLEELQFGMNMSHRDIRFWKGKLNILENTEKIQLFYIERGENCFSFYEALALHIAEGYCKTSSFNISSHRLQIKSAA